MTPQQQAEELLKLNCQHGTRLVLMCRECVANVIDGLNAEIEGLKNALKRKG